MHCDGRLEFVFIYLNRRLNMYNIHIYIYIYIYALVHIYKLHCICNNNAKFLTLFLIIPSNLLATLFVSLSI